MLLWLCTRDVTIPIPSKVLHSRGTEAVTAHELLAKLTTKVSRNSIPLNGLGRAILWAGGRNVDIPDPVHLLSVTATPLAKARLL